MIPLLLADDFSGACDAAARAGIPHALLDLRGPEISGACAVSTETRHASAAEARSRLRSLDSLARGRILYKKIDSTLRGPWVEEVDELLHFTDYHQALVCPAFPALGRTVRHGWLCVDGEPLQQIVCPYTVRDAENEEDLARIAAEVCSSILPVGSAGLARHIFRGQPPVPSLRPPASGPWLVLVGSEHPASQAQLQYLREARPPGVSINPRDYPQVVGGVFATGGETAARFLRQTGARGIGSLRELLPGVAAGRILGGRYNELVMITKAGGFGSPDTILRALEMVR